MENRNKYVSITIIGAKRPLVRRKLGTIIYRISSTEVMISSRIITWTYFSTNRVHRIVQFCELILKQSKSGLISEGILSLVPLPTKGAKSLS